MRGDKLEVLAADLRGKYIKNEMQQLVKVAIWCIQVSSSDRPKMSDVVRELEGGDGLEEGWDTKKEMQETGRVEFEHVLDIMKIDNEFFSFYLSS